MDMMSCLVNTQSDFFSAFEMKNIQNIVTQFEVEIKCLVLKCVCFSLIYVSVFSFLSNCIDGIKVSVADLSGICCFSA